MALPRPGLPVLAWDLDATQGPPNTPGNSRVSLDSRGCAVQNANVKRGRQYELGVMEAGTADLTVFDPKELLDPGNTASPFNSGGNTLLPYRCVWGYAYWRPSTLDVSGNLFNSAVNAAYDPSFESGTSGFTAGGGTTLASSAAQAAYGTKSLLVTQGGNTSAAWPSVLVPGAPRLTLTVSVSVYLTGGANLQIQCPDGTNSTVVTTQTAWTRVSVTYVATDSVQKIVFAGTNTATPTYYLDGFQVEFAATASAFTTSGPTRYSIYTGYVERYPQTWTDAGFRGMKPLQCVDAVSVLARTVINQMYATTISADSPALTVSYADTGPPGLYLFSGQPVRPVQGITSISQGGAINWGGDTFPDGTKVLSLTQQTSTLALNQQYTYVDLTNGTLTGQQVSLNTNASTAEFWVKLTEGGAQCDFAVIPGAGVHLQDPATTYLGLFMWNGRIGPMVNIPALGFFLSQTPDQVGSPWRGFPDGQWHYLAITFTNGGANIIFTVDNVSASYTGLPGSTRNALGCNSVHAHATTSAGDGRAQVAVANFAYYGTDIGNTRRLAHYQRGVGYLNELSGARVTRLLGQYWGGGTSVAAGYIKMAPDIAYQGRTMLDVCQEIAYTEGGTFYANKAGLVVFEDRSSRYATQTSTATIGENPSELHYDEIEFDWDPTYVYSQVNLTRPGNNAYPPKVNQTSKTNYGQRILSQTIQVNTDFDVDQAAIFYLNRYATAKKRIRKLTFNPAANPALWAFVLSLEISQRITGRRRTSAGTVTNEDYYVEQIGHTITAEDGSWLVDVQLSPVFVPSAWVLGDATYGVLGTTSIPVY